jgi:hypothetical protein
MNEREIKAMLQALFEMQADDDDAPGERHYMALLRRGGPWPEAELAVLARSPRARLALDIAVERLRLGLLSDWRRRGWSEPLPVPLAAASAEESHLFVTPGYELQLDHAASGEWIVALTLRRELLAAVSAEPAMTVQLRDESGRVWLEGRPDRHGVISGFWAWPDESPARRLAAIPLRVVPALAPPSDDAP